MWGFSVEAELIENAERQDELCCYVSRVEDKSVALQNGKENKNKTFLIAWKLLLAKLLDVLKMFLPLLSFEIAGIIKADEIIVINGAIVSDLDMMYLESVLQEEQTLSMMMR